MVEILPAKNTEFEVRRIAEALHLLACTKSHTKGECDWYGEQTIEGCWEEETHKKWLSLACHLVESHGSSVEKTLEVIRGISNACSKMLFLLDNHPETGALIKEVIKVVIIDRDQPL